LKCEGRDLFLAHEADALQCGVMMMMMMLMMMMTTTLIMIMTTQFI